MLGAQAARGSGVDLSPLEAEGRGRSILRGGLVLSAPWRRLSVREAGGPKGELAAGRAPRGVVWAEAAAELNCSGGGIGILLGAGGGGAIVVGEADVLVTCGRW